MATRDGELSSPVGWLSALRCYYALSLGNGHDFFCKTRLLLSLGKVPTERFLLSIISLSLGARLHSFSFILFFKKENFLNSYSTMNRWLFAAQGETRETWKSPASLSKASTFYCVNRSIQCDVWTKRNAMTQICAQESQEWQL